MTKEFWTKVLPDFEAHISGVVLDEIRATPDDATRKNMEALVKNFRVLALTREADELAQEYMRTKVFPTKYATDANHVAIAVSSGIGYLISWNYRHLVKVSTRHKVNSVNAMKGFSTIEIITPPEL